MKTPGVPSVTHSLVQEHCGHDRSEVWRRIRIWIRIRLRNRFVGGGPRVLDHSALERDGGHAFDNIPPWHGNTVPCKGRGTGDCGHPARLKSGGPADCRASTARLSGRPASVVRVLHPRREGPVVVIRRIGHPSGAGWRYNKHGFGDQGPFRRR